MAVTVRVIGGVRREVRTVDIEGTVADLLAHLHLSSQAYLVAIDDEMVSTDTVLGDGDEVSLIRAVAGG